jgi:1-acyl-sn-glycerol-3-phosphate acyltransferase
VTRGTIPYRLKPIDRTETRAQEAFDRWAAFCGKPAAHILMAIWSFAEAIVWPIIPDFLLFPMVVGRSSGAGRPLAACIAGSAIGATILYGAASARPTEALRILPHLPLVFAEDIASVERRIERDGPIAYLWQPISGIPFKVWGVMGAVNSLPPEIALPIVIVARSARMVVLALVGILIGRGFAPFIRDRFIILVGLYVIIFVLGWIKTLPNVG